MTWEPAPLPGIFSKPLFNDVNRQYVTQIVRMDPGTTYPSHRHSQVEELYLLEGDLLVEGQKMGPGERAGLQLGHPAHLRQCLLGIQRPLRCVLMLEEKENTLAGFEQPACFLLDRRPVFGRIVGLT